MFKHRRALPDLQPVRELDWLEKMLTNNRRNSLRLRRIQVHTQVLASNLTDAN